MHECTHKEDIDQMKIDIAVLKSSNDDIKKEMSEVKEHIQKIYTMVDNKISTLVYWMLGAMVTFIISAGAVILGIVLSNGK